MECILLVVLILSGLIKLGAYSTYRTLFQFGGYIVDYVD